MAKKKKAAKKPAKKKTVKKTKAKKAAKKAPAKKTAKKVAKKKVSKKTKAKKVAKKVAKKATKKVAKKAAKKTAKKVAAKKIAKKAPAKKTAKKSAKTAQKPKAKSKKSAKDKEEVEAKGVELLEDEEYDEEEYDEGEELQAEEDGPEGHEEVILTDAEGRRLCKVLNCDQVAVVDGFCRYHYLLLWKRIQIRKKILSEGKLEKYIEELTSRYPNKYLEVLKKDLKSPEDFLHAIQELEIDDSGPDSEYEEDAQSYIEEVRGMQTAGGSDNEAEDDY